MTFLNSEESVYLSAEGVKGVAKPYRGGAYSFVGLLPTDESANVAEFAASLTGEQWTALWKTRRNEKVQTRIPEFKCEDQTALKDLLKAMGMTDLFNPGAADLSAMGRSDGGNLYVSGVDQKTYLELDRKGTKAAAVTWATLKTRGVFIVPNTVYLDRPFVYLIVDNATGLPLFLGITENL